MEYRIVLQRMEFRALHGCYELERKVGNRFTVDLEITACLGDAAAEDSVEQTVNYLTVYEVVSLQMRITQRTIERVAMNIIEAVYASFRQVRHVKCTVSKLAPPLGGKLEKVSVVLEKYKTARTRLRARSFSNRTDICIIHTAAQRWAAN